MKVVVDITDDLAEQLRSPGQDLSRSALEALALEGYRSGKLTDAEVRRLLGYQTRMEVDGFLKQHGVYLDYTLEDLERESAVNDRLWQKRQLELAQEAEHRRLAG